MSAVAALSARARRQPVFADDIAWDTPLAGHGPHFPHALLPIFGTEAWAAMDDDQRDAEARRYCAEFFTACSWFENTIIHFLVRQAYALPPTSDVHEFLLIETAEECRHSLAFNRFVRASGVTVEGPPGWVRFTTRFLRATATDLEAMVAALMTEDLIDVINREMARDDDLHPVPRQIAALHIADETRHVAFARMAIRDDRSSRAARFRAGLRAPVVAFSIARVLECQRTPHELGPAYTSRLRESFAATEQFLATHRIGGRVSSLAWRVAAERATRAGRRPSGRGGAARAGGRA